MKPTAACTRFAALGMLLVLLLAAGGTTTARAEAESKGSDLRPDHAQVIEHWTAARRRAAIPRDLVIDEHGRGRLITPGEASQGRQLSAAPAAHPSANAGGPSGGDTTPPAVANMDPAEGATIGASYAFAADVTDASGIRSVYVTIRYPDGATTQRFQASRQTGDRWSVTISGFTGGAWSWRVEAKDGAPKGGNVTETPYVGFLVDTGSGGGGGGGGGGGEGTVPNAEWQGGLVQTAVGRIYFEMPGNAKRKGPWSGYVCSGTVAVDGASGRSIVLTAAHCVYDDANKAFARNVLFIPDQAGTTGSGTDLSCSNDPLGCWVASYGVVDAQYTTRTFPSNNAWDYAYYVVDDVGAHAGNGSTSALDAAAGALSIAFTSPTLGALTHGLGYSYNHDPNLMYCADSLGTEGAVNWWLPGCGLSSGSSGGPWIEPFDEPTGAGPIVSVNSWGYTTGPGMAGPKLSGTSAACLFDVAAAGAPPPSTADGDEGHKVSCP